MWYFVRNVFIENLEFILYILSQFLLFQFQSDYWLLSFFQWGPLLWFNSNSSCKISLAIILCTYTNEGHGQPELFSDTKIYYSKGFHHSCRSFAFDCTITNKLQITLPNPTSVKNKDSRSKVRSIGAHLSRKQLSS